MSSQVELGAYEVPFNSLPESHYGYLLKDASTGHFKVGITHDLKKRLANYRTHNKNIVVAYVEAFPSKKWASAWERRVMFVAGSSDEWIGPLGEWILFVTSGAGRHVGLGIGQFVSSCGEIVTEIDLALMSRNGADKGYLTSLLEQIA